MDNFKLICEARRCEDKAPVYYNADKAGLLFCADEVSRDEIKRVYRVNIKNDGKDDFSGVIHVKVWAPFAEPAFFMPGYMYNRNTADFPSTGRKCFPRIKKGADTMPESEFFMTRSDRLAEPVSIAYESGNVIGIAANPCLADNATGCFINYNGFSCRIKDEGGASVGFTLGYENAPWLFVQTATVLEREPVTSKNAFVLKTGSEYSFEMTVYSYHGEDERAVHRAIKDAYWQFHQSPRLIPGMDVSKALALLSGAIRDYAWLEDEKIYTGFVYDKPEGFSYNRIPSISWTNGLAAAVPVLMAANRLGDEKARAQCLTFIEEIIAKSYNPASGFMYESVEEGKPSVRGWWYNGMHSGGHSAYINGQAVYYILKAYVNEKQKGVVHTEWLEFVKPIVAKMNTLMNTDFEFPFSMSEKTGAALEYDSMGGAWFLAASAMYELVSGERNLIPGLLKSEAHYFASFVQKVECYGGPLDTDKAVDSEGILSYIRAVRLLHEITGEEVLLDHLRDALYYEYTFKLGYNTVVQVPPLSTLGWSSCGGSITSTANPHIHPMSSTVVSEMRYYLKHRNDEYILSRTKDTVAWGLQTFNTKDNEYDYGKPGWMSERFCFCQGLLTEYYPDGAVASTWFALMPWASGSIIEGFVEEN